MLPDAELVRNLAHSVLASNVFPASQSCRVVDLLPDDARGVNLMYGSQCTYTIPVLQALRPQDIH